MNDDEDDLLFLSSVLNNHQKSDSRIENRKFENCRKFDESDERLFARIRDDAKLSHSVDRLKRRVELMDARKDELEGTVKELKYVNGYLSKELEDMKEEESKNEEKVDNLVTTIKAGHDIINSMKSPLQSFGAFIDYSFSSISLSPNSANVPPTLAKLRSIYLDFDKLLCEATLLFENTTIPNQTKTVNNQKQQMQLNNTQDINDDNNNNKINNIFTKSTNSKTIKSKTKLPNTTLNKENNNNNKLNTTTRKNTTSSRNSTNNVNNSNINNINNNNNNNVVSILEQENNRLKKEILETKEKEEFLSASIPHYRMAILKFKAHMKSLQDQLDVVSDERTKVIEELRILQAGVEDSESEKLSARKQLSFVQDELANTKNNLYALQQKYTMNQSIVDELQQTNHSLRIALEDQLQRNSGKEREKMTERKREYDIEKEETREYKETKWQNIPDYNPSNFGYDNLHQPNTQPLSNHPHYPSLSPSPPHSHFLHPHSQSSSLSPSVSLSHPLSPSHSHSPSFFVPPTNHLRKELDNLDAEIEHLQASLQRQLLEISSPH